MMAWRYKPLDGDALADAARVHRASFDHALPTLAGLHTPEEDRWYWTNVLAASCEIWGAFDGTQLTAVTAFRSGWIEQLYVLPIAQRSGAGSGLLRIAKERHPVLQLWTFQRNAAARRFYERHGFMAVLETDGAENEEKEPDVLLRWSSV